jgi:four helix bundle protein
MLDVRCWMLENNKSIMNRRRHNYKNLKIWLLAMEIVNDVFELLADFPSDERFGLKSQISRCSISIPSNIAEGSARTEKSFSHFIDVSLGSFFELETQLLIALKRNYIKKDKFEEIESKLMEFQKMTIGFQKTL